MTDVQQRKAAKSFAEQWKDKGYEKGESQLFWVTLLTDVFGVTNVVDFIEFEDQVHLDHTSFIDAYIPSTKVLIEQKGLGKDLTKAIRQSDGSFLTPFQQAKRYITELPLSRHPRWVITCNFAEFHIYDMEKPGGDPEKIKLADLEKEYYRLSFLTESGNVHIQKEMEISIKAGEVVGLLYDAFRKQYKNPDDQEALKSLNKLCVRLVFCLYAEDAGIFGRRELFHDYMAQFATKDMRKGLVQLFTILDQKEDELSILK
ncbi:MAG: methylase, partial [Ruminococcaceae bacterium]|nr:methylase [Oscillospiraceae bacterium]